MSRKTLTVIIASALTAVAIVAAYILSSHRHDASTGTTAAQSLGTAGSFYGVTVELHKGARSCDTVAMGSMHEGERVVRKIRFVNRSDEPLTLVDYRSSCGCTSIALPRHAIAPEAFADADCIFDSRGEYGEQLNVVEIAASDAATTAVLLIEAEVER